VGLGRIVMQKHLPGLKRGGYEGEVKWKDPALKVAPSVEGVRVAGEAGFEASQSHVVMTAPWVARAQLLGGLQAKEVLLEKPLAVSAGHLAEMRSALEGKNAAVLHNYRFKPNVLAWRRFLKERPSGALRGVTLHYETPSPANEQSAWMKQERKHRILLCDYALHYLDLAWMHCMGPMEIHRCGVSFNDREELETVSAALSFSGVPCDVLIRSGCHQRQCVVTHHFQNYSTELRFFPDVFVAMTGGKSWVDDAKLATKSLVSTGEKVLEKLGVRVADRSHDTVLASFVGKGDAAVMEELSVKAMLPFYERLTQLADAVYE
jgi:VCBS repeat-containing protein